MSFKILNNTATDLVDNDDHPLGMGAEGVIEVSKVTFNYDDSSTEYNEPRSARFLE